MDPDGAAVPAWVQRSALRRVDLAFKAFFRRCKAGQTPGFPRFRSKRRYDSFDMPEARVAGKTVAIPKIGPVKFHQYRPLRGTVLRVTIRREGEAWWVCFACDLGSAPEKAAPVSIVGIDVGLKSLAVTSDGDVVDNPRHAAKAAARLARAQRIVARRKRGSKSRKRAVALVARHHAHVKNQRLDHARKTAAWLVSRYDVIAHEDLNIAGLGRSALSGHIQNAGWGILLHAIACKAEEAGKHVVAVDPRHTSQTCSGCGVLVPKDLSVRVHDCPHCGLRMDRDHNAAVNICALGRSAVPWPDAFDPAQARSGLEAA
jgi:putative transposase